MKIYKNTLCDAVKIEGSKEIAPTIKLLDQNGIAVIAHIGLKPQLSRQEGGYRVAGKDDKEAKSILEDALALESAGAKMVLIEGVPSDLAKEITKALKVPTIGIGAGACLFLLTFSTPLLRRWQQSCLPLHHLMAAD